MNIEQRVQDYVDSHIHEFHEARITKLQEMKLDHLLERKNPYLYKAKNLNTPGEVVGSLAQAFMSSAEETLFGNWLENLAIYIAGIVYNGQKSIAKGIDLEMDKDGIRYIVSIKSGPNWSNSSSMEKLRDYFKTAMRVYRTSGGRANIIAIEGCCYGKEYKIDNKDNHYKICGQRFWEFVSGDHELYSRIIEPLGHNAHEQNELYQKEYDRMITKFTKNFSLEYCDNDGNIEWDKILLLNSGEKEMAKQKSSK